MSRGQENYFPSGTSVLTVLDTARETRKSCHALVKLSVPISIVFEKSMCHKPFVTLKAGSYGLHPISTSLQIVP
jgi:hypothetical protein